MKSVFLILWCFIFLQDVPYKPSDQFEIKLDYKFKQKPHRDVNTVDLTETMKERHETAALLPFLVLNVKMIKLEDEVKLKVENNSNSKTAMRKIEVGTIVPVEIGFTDDAKDGVSANQYTLTLLTDKKEKKSRIVIQIDKDGSFLVNGEKRGKF